MAIRKVGWVGKWALADVLYAIGLAMALGVGGGWLIAAAIARLQARQLPSSELDGFFAPATVTALVVYGVAALLGAYGLLAVFAAGMAFRRHELDHVINARIHHGAETAGRLSTVVVQSRDLSPGDTTRVVWTTIVCVVVAIAVHGITATPLTRRLLG